MGPRKVKNQRSAPDPPASESEATISPRSNSFSPGASEQFETVSPQRISISDSDSPAASEQSETISLPQPKRIAKPKAPPRAKAIPRPKPPPRSKAPPLPLPRQIFLLKITSFFDHGPHWYHDITVDLSVYRTMAAALARVERHIDLVTWHNKGEPDTEDGRQTSGGRRGQVGSRRGQGRGARGREGRGRAVQGTSLTAKLIGANAADNGDRDAQVVEAGSENRADVGIQVSWTCTAHNIEDWVPEI